MMTTFQGRAKSLKTYVDQCRLGNLAAVLNADEVDILNQYYPGWSDEGRSEPKEDPVNHPKHYNSHPSGVECITVTEHMGFNVGNAVKYLWRADEKGNAIQDLEKAAWYVNREINKRKGIK